MKTMVGIFAVMFVAQAALAAPHGIYPTKQFASKARAEAAIPDDEPAAGQGNLLYYGGQVIAHAKVYAVMWGPNVKASTSSAVGGFFKAVTNSTHFDFLGQYNTVGIKAQDGRDGTN